MDFWRRKNNPEKTAEFERKVAELERQIAEAQGQLEEARRRLDPEGDRTTELALIRKRFEMAERSGRRALDRLVSVVELDDEGPDTIIFGLHSDGSLKVSVLGWAPGSVRRYDNRNTSKRSFTTEDGLVTNTAFDSSNGRIEFDVPVYSNADRTELEATYHFKMFPTEYAKTDDPTDGRIFFSGDVWREAAVGPLCSVVEFHDTGCRRKGIVKLVSRASRQ
mgnify:FL=1